MRIVVVMNAKAGTLASRDANAVASAVRTAFAHAGHTINLSLVAPAEMEGAIRRGLNSRPDVLVVGGGDGSLHSTINQMGENSSVALGILPMGTMNLTARDIGLPLDPVEAAKALARGYIGQIDVAALGTTRFLNAAVLGFYPWMVMDRERARRRRGLSKWVAMTRAGWRALFRRHEIEIEVALDIDTGETSRMRTPLLVVANNRFQDGAGPVPSKASLTDGELAVYVAEAAGPLALLRLAVAVAAGRWESAPGLHFLPCRALTVSSRRRKRVRIALDGEIRYVHPPLEFCIQERLLPFLMPAAGSPHGS